MHRQHKEMDSDGTPVLAGKKMSSSLKERLKKSRRQLSSPLLTNKGTKCIHVLDAANDHKDTSASSEETKTCETSLPSHKYASTSANIISKTPLQPVSENDHYNNDSMNSSCDADNNTDRNATNISEIDDTNKDNTTGEASHHESVTDLKQLKSSLEAEIKQKQETLRKLNMVKMYRSKHDLVELRELTDKWRGVCQQAVLDLHELTTSSPRPTLTQLIDHLHLPHHMLAFNHEEETFS